MIGRPQRRTFTVVSRRGLHPRDPPRREDTRGWHDARSLAVPLSVIRRRTKDQSFQAPENGDMKFSSRILEPRVHAQFYRAKNTSTSVPLSHHNVSVLTNSIDRHDAIHIRLRSHGAVPLLVPGLAVFDKVHR
jgi:hypothetical protein